MPSLIQVQEHQARVNQQMAEEEAARRRATEQQAAIEAERMRLASMLSREQMGQQAALQNQQQLVQGDIQAGRDFRLAGLQERQDFQQQQYRMDLMGREQAFQGQQQYNAASYAMQQATHVAGLNAELSQIQLNQQEQAAMNRMQQALQRLGEQERNGQLSSDEAADLRTQIMTGLNPLQNRATRAQIAQAQVQTANAIQQAQQNAILFNQDMEYRAMDPARRFQTIMVSDGQGGQVPVTMQMTSAGNWQQVDINAPGRANLQTMASVAGTVSNINAQQIRSRGDEIANDMALFNLQNAPRITQANLDQTYANTQRVLASIANDELLVPANVANLAAHTGSILAATARADEIQPYNLAHLGEQTNVLRQSLEEARQRFDRNELAIPIELDQARANAETAIWNLADRQARAPNERRRLAADTTTAEATAAVNHAASQYANEHARLTMETLRNATSRSGLELTEVRRRVRNQRTVMDMQNTVAQLDIDRRTSDNLRQLIEDGMGIRAQARGARWLTSGGGNQARTGRNPNSVPSNIRANLQRLAETHAETWAREQRQAGQTVTDAQKTSKQEEIYGRLIDQHVNSQEAAMERRQQQIDMYHVIQGLPNFYRNMLPAHIRNMEMPDPLGAQDAAQPAPGLMNDINNLFGPAR